MNIDSKYTFIFDLDGTLIDSYKVIVDSLYILAKKYNVNDIKEDINRIVIEHSVPTYINLLSKDTNISFDLLMDEYRKLNDTNKDNIELMPNVINTLNKLNELNVKCFIYTHRGASTHYLLNKLNIKDYFIEVITSENGFKRKPSGEVIDYLVDKYKLNKEYTYYVGDRNIDIDCALDAKVKAILYKQTNSYCIENGLQDIIVNDLLDIFNN